MGWIPNLKVMNEITINKFQAPNKFQLPKGQILFNFLNLDIDNNWVIGTLPLVVSLSIECVCSDHLRLNFLLISSKERIKKMGLP